MTIKTSDLALAALLAIGVILTDAWITAAIIVLLALGFLLGSDKVSIQNRLTMGVFFWSMFTVFSQGNLWYRAQYDLPTIEKEYTYRRAGTEAGVALSTMGQRNGGTFTFLKELSDEDRRIFPRNPVWTYSVNFRSDSLLTLYMVLRTDPGSDPMFPNANGFMGMKQYRLDITPGEVPDILVEN
jgi:hypothetical protein